MSAISFSLRERLSSVTASAAFVSISGSMPQIFISPTVFNKTSVMRSALFSNSVSWSAQFSSAKVIKIRLPPSVKRLPAPPPYCKNAACARRVKLYTCTRFAVSAPYSISSARSDSNVYCSGTIKIVFGAVLSARRLRSSVVLPVPARPRINSSILLPPFSV